MSASILAKAMSEKELTSAVVECAQSFGWLVYHALPAQTRTGRHLTATQGNIGFPDIVCARYGEVIVAELKAERRYPTPEQLDWLTALHGPYLPGSGRVRAFLWRPTQWLDGTIERVLRGGMA